MQKHTNLRAKNELKFGFFLQLCFAAKPLTVFANPHTHTYTYIEFFFSPSLQLIFDLYCLHNALRSNQKYIIVYVCVHRQYFYIETTIRK